MPPAMNGHRLLCLPSVKSRRPTSVPSGLMSFTKLMFLTSAPDVLHLGLAVVDEDEAALVRMHDVLLAAALEHHELAHRAVEVPGVVRQFLVVGLELAGVGVEQDHRGGVEVVARARALGLPVGPRPVVQRRRVAGAPPHGVGLGVVAAGHPAAAAAGLPGVVAPGVARVDVVLVAAHRVELPHLLAGLGVDAEDRSAVGPFAALRADDDLVLHQQRRAGEAHRQLLGVDQLGLPVQLAGLHVDARPACRRACPCRRCRSPSAMPRL